MPLEPLEAEKDRSDVKTKKFLIPGFQQIKKNKTEMGEEGKKKSDVFKKIFRRRRSHVFIYLEISCDYFNLFRV